MRKARYNYLSNKYLHDLHQIIAIKLNLSVYNLANFRLRDHWRPVKLFLRTSVDRSTAERSKTLPGHKHEGGRARKIVLDGEKNEGQKGAGRGRTGGHLSQEEIPRNPRRSGARRRRDAGETSRMIREMRRCSSHSNQSLKRDDTSRGKLKSWNTRKGGERLCYNNSWARKSKRKKKKIRTQVILQYSVRFNLLYNFFMILTKN